MDKYSQVLNRVDFAGNDERHAANQRAVCRIGWEQSRLWIAFLQVLDDSQRLGQDPSVIFKRRDERLWIDGSVEGGKLLAAAAPQMDRHLLVSQSLQVERDTYSIGRRAAKERI